MDRKWRRERDAAEAPLAYLKSLCFISLLKHTSSNQLLNSMTYCVINVNPSLAHFGII
jgi:hypothetical protein